MKIQQPKSQKQGQICISCLKEPTFCTKTQPTKLAQNLRKLAALWDESGTINPYITYRPVTLLN